LLERVSCLELEGPNDDESVLETKQKETGISEGNMTNLGSLAGPIYKQMERILRTVKI